MRREYGVGGHRVEQPGDPPQPLGHGHPPCPGQPEPLPHGLLQFHDAVGDVPDRVGDVQPQRGRAVAGGDESVPLFQEEGLGALLAEPVGGRRGGGAMGGGGAAGGEFDGEFGELLEQHADPEGGVRGRVRRGGRRTPVRQGSLPRS